MASVRWSLNARRNLFDTIVDLDRTSDIVALALVRRIDAAVQNLAAFPRIGRVLRNYEDDGIHEVPVGNYRLIYALDDDEVRMIALLHTRRDVRRALGPSPRDIQ
jgi:plasmid stabilization system protein ParE